MKEKQEEILAQCYLRYNKGNADPSYHAYLTPSKLFLRKGSNDYETYSLKHISGIHISHRYRWPWIILGILLTLIAFFNNENSLIPLEKPVLSARAQNEIAYHEIDSNYIVSLDTMDEEISYKKWKDTNEIWTGALLAAGLTGIVIGMKKRSFMVLLMNNSNLMFRVYMVSPEYLHFIKTLEDRVGHN